MICPNPLRMIERKTVICILSQLLFPAILEVSEFSFFFMGRLVGSKGFDIPLEELTGAWGIEMV